MKRPELSVTPEEMDDFAREIGSGRKRHLPVDDQRDTLSPIELAELEAMLAELRKREITGSRDSAEFYPKQIEFMMADAEEVIMIAGNQTGKSHAASFAMACDLEGIYPDWWTGPRTTRAIRAWCVGVTNESTRDNCQYKLWGPDYEVPGGGWLNPERIVKWTRRAGVAGAIDTIWIKHISGELSVVTFKANEMGATKLMGPSLDRVWWDEEIDKDVHEELAFRTIARPGAITRGTFTSLRGYTDLVLSLVDQEDGTTVKIIHVKGTDVRHADGRTHMTEERKDKIRRRYKDEPHLLAARLDGDITQGTGLIYPSAKHLFVPPFPLSPWFPRIGGADFGWRHPTVFLVAAWDKDADALYVYGCHQASEMEPMDHVKRIMKWGDVDFACDPAGFQSDKKTGEKLLEEYNKLMNPMWHPRWDEKRWRMFPADNAVNMGIAKVHDRIETDRIFFFDIPELEIVKKELGLYRWDENTPNKPFKKHDDALDALRYLVMSLHRARLMGKALASQSDGSEIAPVRQWKRREEGY